MDRSAGRFKRNNILFRAAVIPGDRKADWYARGVGGAAAREITGIPAGRQQTEESNIRPAGISDYDGHLGDLVSTSPTFQTGHYAVSIGSALASDITFTLADFVDVDPTHRTIPFLLVTNDNISIGTAGVITADFSHTASLSLDLPPEAGSGTELDAPVSKTPEAEGKESPRSLFSELPSGYSRPCGGGAAGGIRGSLTFAGFALRFRTPRPTSLPG